MGEAVPVRTRVRVEYVTEEQCLHCGRYVTWTVYARRGRWKYVRCPQCGTRHCVSVDGMRIRLVNSP